MIYEKNLSQLKYSENDIYEKICDPDFCWDEGRSVIEYAKNGEPVLVYIQEDGTKEYLGSRYNPTQEAEKFMADCVDLPEKATLVLVGFGNGAHIREFMSIINRHVQEHPILVDKYLMGKEVEVDACLLYTSPSPRD